MGLKGLTVNTAPEAEPHIYAEDDAAIYQAICGSDGVFDIGQKCESQVISNNKVRVKDGVIIVGGHFARIPYGDYIDFEIANGQAGKKRNDILIAKFTTTGSGGIDTFTGEVKQGAASTEEATDPALTQNDIYQGGKIREMPLYRVKLDGLSITKVEPMFDLIPTIPTLNKYLSQMMFYESNNNGNWTISKYPAGWTELHITAIVPRASTEAYVQKLDFPDGIQLKNAQTFITAARNGWNVANYYHNNDNQDSQTATIDHTNLVFSAKTAQSLDYYFEVLVCGFEA